MKSAKAFLLLAFFAMMIIVDPAQGFGQGPPPDQPDLTIDAATRKEVIDTLLKRLNDAYVFPETAAHIGDAAVTVQRGKHSHVIDDHYRGVAGLACGKFVSRWTLWNCWI